MKRTISRNLGVNGINLSLFNSILTELTIYKKWSISSFFGSCAMLMRNNFVVWVEVSHDGSVLIYRNDGYGQKIGCRKTLDNYR